MSLWLVLPWLIAAQSKPATQPWSDTATRPADGAKIVTVQPGVRIDWSRRTVEVDAVVVLRQGSLELMVCAPRIREHESILRIEARPLHVYQALGLIGLTPGHPPTDNPETGETLSATGDAVQVEVRYQISSGAVTEPVERWLKRANSTAPLEPLPWVFAGSVVLENGTFAADVEGTVVAVVDFPSSLIAVAESHTSRNEELWLEPRTVAIPAVGQQCVLLLRPGPKLVRVDATGRVYWENQSITLGELMAVLLRSRHENPHLSVGMECDPHCPAAAKSDVTAMLQRCVPDFRPDTIRYRPVRPLQPATQPTSERSSSAEGDDYTSS